MSNEMSMILERFHLFERQSKQTKDKEQSEKIRSYMGGSLSRGQDDELRKLSKGMMEGDELELEDDELELDEKKKREGQEQSIPGNRYHLGGTAKGVPADKAGQFTTADKAHSESIGFWDKDRPGTIRGKWRRSGRGREKRWTALGCGRKDKEGSEKAKNKCSVRETSHPDLRTSDELEPLEPYITLSQEGLKDTIIEAIRSFVEVMATEEEQNINEDPKRCPPGCGHTWASVLKSINAAVNASSGKLYQDKGGS